MYVIIDSLHLCHTMLYVTQTQREKHIPTQKKSESESEKEREREKEGGVILFFFASLV